MSRRKREKKDHRKVQLIAKQKSLKYLPKKNVQRFYFCRARAFGISVPNIWTQFLKILALDEQWKERRKKWTWRIFHQYRNMLAFSWNKVDSQWLCRWIYLLNFILILRLIRVFLILCFLRVFRWFGRISMPVRFKRWHIKGKFKRTFFCTQSEANVVWRAKSK